MILSKLDGDTRGGAALSIKEVTGVPIKFIGIGEQLDKLEPFHADRMAGRILGMGDIVSLFEKAAEQMDEEEVARQQAKMAEGSFNLEDFRDQMKMIRRMGSLKDLIKMIPGFNNLFAANPDIDADGQMGQIEAVINSMTKYERTHPDKIDRSRRNRIARGSGTEPSEINRLLKDFQSMSGMAKDMSKLGFMDRMKALRGLSSSGMMNPGGGFRAPKGSTKQSPANQQAAEEKRRKARKDAKKQKKKNR